MTTALPYGSVVIDPEDGETLMVLHTVNPYKTVWHVTLRFPPHPEDTGELGSYTLGFMQGRYEVIE